MKKYLTYLRFLSCLLCIIILSSHLLACTKKSDELTLKGDKISQSDSQGNINKKVNEQPQSDKVYFGMWTGSRLLIDDFYKFNENENFKGDTTGEGYGKYRGDFRDLLKKYGMFDEQKSEYFFDEAKPEFSSFTTFKKGDKLFVSTSKGVYACEVNGFVIDLNYEVGAGTIFYPTLNLP